MGVILALIMSVFVGSAAGYLGTLMLSKKMALVAGPLGHLTMPGIALALIFNLDVSIVSFSFVILGIIVIWLFELRTKLPMESLTAIVFSIGVAITFLFLPEEKTIPALIGDVSQLTISIVVITSLISLLIILLTNKIYKKIVLIEISEDIAKSVGINIKKYNLIYLLCIALIVSLGVRIVGGLLTAALVAIPASTSRNLSINLRQYSFLGLILGGLSSITGIIAFSYTGIPVGLLIIFSSASFFLISLFFKRVNT